MQASFVIRQEKPGDEGQIFEVVLAAFGQQSEALLVNELRQDSAAWIPELSLVAVDPIASKIVGHILVTEAGLKGPDETRPILALAPLAVHPDYQNRGVGSALVRKSEEVAKNLIEQSQRNIPPLVIVLGHENYYLRFGFEVTKPFGIQTAFPVTPEHLMLLQLIPDAAKGYSGAIQYPPAFDKV